jgi:hypothetical protein
VRIFIARILDIIIPQSLYRYVASGPKLKKLKFVFVLGIFFKEVFFAHTEGKILNDRACIWTYLQAPNTFIMNFTFWIFLQGLKIDDKFWFLSE